MRASVICFTFLLLSTPVALASPESEARPDCEATQPLLGYRSTRTITDAWEAQGRPAGLWLCEGEHWDGQDTSDAALDCVVCMGSDPNREPGDDLLDPAGLRASASGDAAYVAVNVGFVARLAVYADSGSVALYARDNTPGNMIATILMSPRITQPIPSESDCDQAAYQAGAEEGFDQCHRENTAITLEHGLLP